MQIFRYSWVLSLICVAKAQDYLNFPPLQYQHGSPYYQQPSFPPHFRPLGYSAFASPAYKPFSYHSLFAQQDPSVYQNDLRHPVSNPFIPGFNSYYQQYPQYDESYPDIDEYNKVQPTFREPIQLIPSRFPQRVENVVEKIQNRFSIYNPGLIVPNVPFLIEIPANETEVKPPSTEGVEVSTVGEGSVTPSANLISSTEGPAVESATEASEESTVKQNLDSEENITESDSTVLPEQSPESSTEAKIEEISTESSTEAATETVK